MISDVDVYRKPKTAGRGCGCTCQCHPVDTNVDSAESAWDEGVEGGPGNCGCHCSGGTEAYGEMRSDAFT